jgi:hypothetical protein
MSFGVLQPQRSMLRSLIASAARSPDQLPTFSRGIGSTTANYKLAWPPALLLTDKPGTSFSLAS